MAARRQSDKEKAYIANMSIKASIKTKNIIEEKPKTKLDLSNVKSSYAQSGMRSSITPKR